MDLKIHTLLDSFWAIEPVAAKSIFQQFDSADEPPGMPSVSVENSVAIIEISGVLQRERKDKPLFGGTATDKLADVINEFANDPEITAIILQVDSPGGSAFGLDAPRDAVTNAAKVKPVIAQVDGLAASAAYRIIAGATHIFASSHEDMIGSIGTRTVLFDTSKLFEDMGVKAIYVDTGEFKSLGAPGKEVSERDIEVVQDIVNTLQDEFTSAVSNGRNLTGKNLDAVLTGQVFLAKRAIQLGLADGIQSLDQTVSQFGGSVEMAKELETTLDNAEATFSELKSIPGVDSDFVCECLEKKYTMDRAKDAWMTKQTELIKAQKEANEELKKANQAKENDNFDDSKLSEGNVNNNSAPVDDPIEEWDSALAGMVSLGMTKAAAVTKIVAEQPELHQAYLQAYTDKHGLPSEQFRRSKRQK